MRKNPVFCFLQGAQGEIFFTRMVSSPITTISFQHTRKVSGFLRLNPDRPEDTIIADILPEQTSASTSVTNPILHPFSMLITSLFCSSSIRQLILSPMLFIFRSHGKYEVRSALCVLHFALCVLRLLLDFPLYALLNPRYLCLGN